MYKATSFAAALPRNHYQVRLRMHRALDCDDILLEIIEHLNCPLLNDVSLRFRNPYLPPCACLCKTISVLALDVLWKYIVGIKCLLNILPCFDLEWDKHAECYKRCDCPAAGDMERFKQYAGRIRTFRFGNTEKDVDSKTIMDVVGWTDQKYMLPNLQSLEWYQCSPSDNTVMSFMTPSLEKLDFTLDRQDNAREVSPSIPDAVSTLLTKLLAAATSLVELRLDLRCCNFPISPPPLIHVQRLQKVTLALPWSALAYHFLRTLSRLDTLTELTVDTATNADEHSEVVDTRQFDRRNSFPQLRLLRVQGPFAHLSFILSAMSSPSINSVYLDATGDEDYPDDCYTFLTMLNIKVAIWSVTLQTVSFRILFNPGLGSWPQFADYMRPLLACNNVRVLIFMPYGMPTFPDKYLAEMPCAWPALVDLNLDCTAGDFNNTPSFSAVADMTRHMPQLRSLIMPCCIDRAGILSLQSNRGPISGQFESFDLSVVVFELIVPQIRLFGELLERLFPRLDIAACMGSPYQQYVVPYMEKRFLKHVRRAFKGARRRQSLAHGHAAP
ncbi:hypothetical protein B0H21DRAFT_195046 [Amylocystis lapponica]|nr:hypothetical protein B0H21DRAFT_195046 [Amylocystis lapponica]